MEVKLFKNLLRQNGNFITKPRLRLFAILQRRPALTMQLLIPLLSQHDQVTVYRNIDLFEELGIVNRIRLGWQTKIELSDKFVHHHHHFSCTNCGKVYDLPDDLRLENEISKLAFAKGFQPADHQLEIRGLCQRCQTK